MFKYGLFYYFGLRGQGHEIQLCGSYKTNTVTASDRATVRMTSQKELKEVT